MFSLKRPMLNDYNKKMRDYCLNTTYESIRKKLSKQDEERKSPKFQLNLVIDAPSVPNPTNPFIPILMFLSMSSLVYYFYNSKK